jgi:AbrB family looped-hinge helix DNA binding protein
MKILGDSKLTAKFQATIPRGVRDVLKLDAGDRLVFVWEHGRISVKKAKLEVQA